MPVNTPGDAGRQIGVYQILAPLGRGGMGEVHLALDTRLGRKVAVKMLAAEFTHDRERVRRFEQEARSASALNHPNIITVYDIGEIESRRYIVEEFVDGETLRQRMTSAPQQRMKPSEAIERAAQIAAALAAAHEAGITHRDIKPENVMVRHDGLVKVLDFGLAKLTEPSAPVPAALVDTQAPTAPGGGTETRIVMGTPRYMSPEQARGEKVDGRTDIFSLGVMLYEMIAGRAPFVGATASEMIAAILRDSPSPLTSHAPDAPPELERIVGKALRKDREERYQVVKDLLLDLESLKQELGIEAKLKGAPPPETVARHTDGNASAHATSSAEYLISEIKRHKRGGAAALATLAIATVALVWFILSTRQSTGTDRLPANRMLNRLTFDAGLQSEPTWSPDGRFIAYSSDPGGNSDIWVRQVDGGNPVQVTKSPAHDSQPDWSPDGANIVFRSERDSGGLFVVSVLGGNERRIASFGFRPRWSPEGSKILFLSSSFRFLTEKSPSQMVSPVIAVSEIGVSAHRMILPIMEVSGSIWVLENVDR